MSNENDGLFSTIDIFLSIVTLDSIFRGDFLNVSQVGEESQHSIPAKQFTDAEIVNVQDRLLSDYSIISRSHKNMIMKKMQQLDFQQSLKQGNSRKRRSSSRANKAPFEYTSATSSPHATTTFSRGGGQTIESIIRDATRSNTGTISQDGEAARQSEMESEELVRDVFVGVYYYPWHADDFHQGDGH